MTRLGLGAAAALAALIVLASLAGPVLAQAGQTEIASAGPLTRIIISDQLNCQVAHREDGGQFQFYSPNSTLGACGTFVALGGQLYGPSFVPSGPLTVGWTPVSQSPVTGSGTADDPFRIVTVVEAAGAGLRVEEVDSYGVGSEAYRTEIRLTNIGAEAIDFTLYRGGDCYLQANDQGFGRVDGSAPACVAAQAAGARIEQWLPVTGGNRFFQGGYSEWWGHVQSLQPLPNTCRCGESLDNGAGISWSARLGPGQQQAYVHDTFFSPSGRPSLQKPLRESVPDPLSITLDPVVVAQSLAVTAGVILLVPFPSALFNNTLEENYDRVLAGLAGIRAWLYGLGAMVLAWLRRQVAARRAGGVTAPSDVSGAAPEPPVTQPGSPNAPAAAVAPRIPAPTTPPPLPPSTAPQGTPAPSTEASPPGIAAPTRAQATDPWRTLPGMALFVLLSALVYAFLDPTFGLSVESLATFVGLFLGLGAVVLAYGLPLVLYARRHGLPMTVRALPATLLIGVACVLLSRLANFQPGYLYGLIIAFFFAGSVPLEHEGRSRAIAAATALVVALAAWIALAVMRHLAPAGGDVGGLVIETAAVSVVIAGVEAVFFSMLPLRFMPGFAVFGWDRRLWAVLFGLGVFAFAHVLLNPSTGYLSDTTRTSFVTAVALLIGFAIGSVLFWAWFRFRPLSRPVGA